MKNCPLGGYWKRQNLFVHSGQFNINDFNFLFFENQFKNKCKSTDNCGKKMRIIIVVEDSLKNRHHPIFENYVNCLELNHIDKYDTIDCGFSNLKIKHLTHKIFETLKANDYYVEISCREIRGFRK